MLASHAGMIRGDIAQVCSTTVATQVPYVKSTIPVTMVVNVFNASSLCTMTVQLEDGKGRVLAADTSNPRRIAPDPTIPDGTPQNDVENQSKTLMATGVRRMTIECACAAATDCVDTQTLCAGRYWGSVLPEKSESRMDD